MKDQYRFFPWALIFHHLLYFIRNLKKINESDLGRAISSSTTEFAEAARKYLYYYCKNTLSLNNTLENAGTLMVDKQEDADIDLSPEKLEKDTIMNLLI